MTAGVGQRDRAAAVVEHAAAALGGIAGDGAVGQRDGATAKVVYRPPPLEAELPLRVQLVNVAVPALSHATAAAGCWRSCR